MPKETTAEKAQRLVDEGRVRPMSGKRGVWLVQGDTSEYNVWTGPAGLRCNCPVYAKQGPCSHILAVGLMPRDDTPEEEIEMANELPEWMQGGGAVTAAPPAQATQRPAQAQYADPRPPEPTPAPYPQAQAQAQTSPVSAGKFQIHRAVKARKKARVALMGPSGSGKTYSALSLAVGLADGGPVVVIDTERGSASLYADQFQFDVLELETFSPDTYTEAIHACAEAGYAVIVIDSLSHAWEGTDGALEQVDNAKARNRGGNDFTAWKDVTPMQKRMVEAILQCKAHVVVTMRTRTEWVLEKDDRGKSVPRKVGMAPIQRAGIEYEFDLTADLDLEHNLVVSKTRLRFLDQKVIAKPGADLGKAILDDLMSGTVAPPSAPVAAPSAAPVVSEAPTQATASEDYPGPPEYEDGPFGGTEAGPAQQLDLGAPEEPVFAADGTPANPQAEVFEKEVLANEWLISGTLPPTLAAATKNSGALRMALVREFGIAQPADHDAMRDKAGYPGVPWETLTQGQLIVIYWMAEGQREGGRS